MPELFQNMLAAGIPFAVVVATGIWLMERWSNRHERRREQHQDQRQEQRRAARRRT